MLEAQWVELEQIFANVSDLGSHHVLVVCYDGDTARVATSVLRAKGINADSVRGGHHALWMHGIGREIASVTMDCSAIKIPIAEALPVSAVPP